MKQILALLLLVAFGGTQLLVTGFSPGAPRRPSTPTGGASTENAAKRALFDSSKLQNGVEEAAKIMTATTLGLLLAVSPVFASDYAGKTISGQDLSGQDLSGRDFISVTAQGTNFRNANLQRADFTGAKLEKADFTGADLREAKFEDAALDGTIMKDVTAQRASFSKTILDIGDFENADLTQSLWPSKYRIMICDMGEIKGTNPVTGVESRTSVMCNSELRYSN